MIYILSTLIILLVYSNHQADKKHKKVTDAQDRIINGLNERITLYEQRDKIHQERYQTLFKNYMNLQNDKYLSDMSKKLKP